MSYDIYDLKTILKEMREYNPKADEFGGKHIIPGWAERVEVAAAKTQDENEYLRKVIKEMDILFGKNLLAMRSACIEAEHGEGDKAGMLWIFNTLFGPGEFAPEEEKDAQAYFNRENEVLDKEFSEVLDWFREYRKRKESQS